MSVVAVGWAHEGRLVVDELVDGFDLVPGGVPKPARVKVRTVVTDPDKIRDFFVNQRRF